MTTMSTPAASASAPARRPTVSGLSPSARSGPPWSAHAGIASGRRRALMGGLIIMSAGDPGPMNRPGSPARAAVRAVIFDAGNTLLRMNYGIIAAHLAARGRAASPEQVEDAELRARVRLDPHLAPGASTESTVTHGRYLRYLLEDLGDHRRRGDRRDRALAARLQPAGRPVEPRRSAGARRAPPACAPPGSWRASSRTPTAPCGPSSRRPGSPRISTSSSTPRGRRREARPAHLRTWRCARPASPPAEAVYVGDLYSVDVLGARAAGLDGILLDPGGFWGPARLPPGARARGRRAPGAGVGPSPLPSPRR